MYDICRSARSKEGNGMRGNDREDSQSASERFAMDHATAKVLPSFSGRDTASCSAFPVPSSGRMCREVKHIPFVFMIRIMGYYNKCII